MRTKTFHLTTCSTEASVVGTTYPQCQTFLKDVELYSPKSIYEAERSVYWRSEFPVGCPSLSDIKLAGRAKVSDFLSTPFARLPLMNMKVIQTLKHLKINAHRIYPIRVYKRRKPLLYFYVAILPFEQSKFIIWEKCRFYETEWAFKNSDLDSIYDKRVDTVVPVFSCLQDYYDYCNSGDFIKTLVPIKIAVNKDFPIDSDYIYFSGLGGRLVSRKFITEISKGNLTGLEFEGPVKIVQYD